MSTVEASLIAARAIHFGAAVVLFGEMLFAWYFAPRGIGSASSAADAGKASRSSELRFVRAAVVAWVCLVISGACWLALVAMQMSGKSLSALDRQTMAAVLGSTLFGRAWVVRALLALALAAMGPAVLAEASHKRVWAPVAALVSGALLASLAWSGHANAQVGVDGVIHHLSDCIHLLAAGTWLGGLLPLAALLSQAGGLRDRRAFGDYANTVSRFGNAAALCVGALVVTGVMNSVYLLPDMHSLFGTSYGRLLLVKISLFVVMLGIASINRRRLTPALNESKTSAAARLRAARSLRLNVCVEQALGAAAIVLVAALGASAPPMRM